MRSRRASSEGVQTERCPLCDALQNCDCLYLGSVCLSACTSPPPPYVVARVLTHTLPQVHAASSGGGCGQAAAGGGNSSSAGRCYRGDTEGEKIEVLVCSWKLTDGLFSSRLIGDNRLTCLFSDATRDMAASDGGGQPRAAAENAGGEQSAAERSGTHLPTTTKPTPNHANGRAAAAVTLARHSRILLPWTTGASAACAYT